MKITDAVFYNAISFSAETKVCYLSFRYRG